eukprot:8267104-Ditylum_brightwellii.AAC.1
MKQLEASKTPTLHMVYCTYAGLFRHCLVSIANKPNVANLHWIVRAILKEKFTMSKYHVMGPLLIHNKQTNFVH